MRRLLPLIIVGVLWTACGESPEVASSNPPRDIATTQLPPATEAFTTTTSTVVVIPPEAPPLDRSVLSLGIEAGDTRPGRFRFRAGNQSEFLMDFEGRYWIMPSGDVYTAVDVDPAVISDEMDRLLTSLDAASGQSGSTPYVESLRSHYGGNEFQIGLTDLIRWAGFGGLTVEWAEQWKGFIEADGTEVPAPLIECAPAIAVFDGAAKRWIAEQPIDLSNGAWTFPELDFERSLREELAATAPCEAFLSSGPNPEELTIRLDTAAGFPTIEVMLDDGLYSDRDAELLFAIAMRSDESVGDMPAPANPASLLTVRNTYLVAIGVCGELPWIYSNFAAANSYHAPGTGLYYGPSILESGWYCEDEVPQSRRDG